MWVVGVVLAKKNTISLRDDEIKKSFFFVAWGEGSVFKLIPEV